MALVLPQSFYARDALKVARDLLGKIICHGEVSLRITETESYCWPHDTANHGFKGKTPRNESMWGAPGHAYVYLCYGLHNMLNFVTNQEGEAAAVLIRAGEPLSGFDLIKKRRRSSYLSALSLTGPGKVAQALAIDRNFCHHPLYTFDGITVFDAPPIKNILTGPRIGIDYAHPVDREAHYRFADANSKYIAKKSNLILQTPVRKPGSITV